MRKIDKFILGSFLGPFVLTFFITTFVLVMQFLWKYVDDMIGKGLETSLILELLFYSSASVVPLALPLAVLLSSLMTFGSMGEFFELSAMKASGISLLRVMRPLILFVCLVSVGAFFFSNNVLPYANLKFGSLLYDIREQKPALAIQEGVFYNGIKGYTIMVGKKESDNRTIRDVMIYNHSSGRGNDDVIIAKSGEMYTTEDEQYLVLKLYDGYQYQEVAPKKKRRRTYEQVRVHFDEFEKVLDLSEFSLQRTDESFFKDHYTMLNVRQLDNAIDTLKQEIFRRKTTLLSALQPNYYFLSFGFDTAWPGVSEAGVAALPLNLHTTENVDKAIAGVRNVRRMTYSVNRVWHFSEQEIVKHMLEWHRKFTLSIACLVLFFIGAPLGAIIRRGGLGMPLVVAVLFFILFHVISMTGEKMAYRMEILPLQGMWLATAVLLPIGIFLSYKAMNDSALLNLNWYGRLIATFIPTDLQVPEENKEAWEEFQKESRDK